MHLPVGGVAQNLSLAVWASLLRGRGTGYGPPMALRFENKVVWITGAGSGIGRALALRLAEEGADIALSGRRLERLEEVAAEVQARGRKGIALLCDVTDEAQVRSACEQVVSAFGRLDVVVANAGFAVSGKFEKLTLGDWRRQFDTNVMGVIATVGAALPHLKETEGRIVLVGSIMALMSASGSGAYAASKHAVRAIGATLAQELFGTGVSCTTIHPGYVESEIGQVDNRGKFHAHKSDRRPAKLMWSAERAAKVMARAIYRRRREVVFTAHGKVGAFVGMHMPGVLHFALTRRS